jgi:hypothetical protein
VVSGGANGGGDHTMKRRIGESMCSERRVKPFARDKY